MLSTLFKPLITASLFSVLYRLPVCAVNKDSLVEISDVVMQFVYRVPVLG